MYSNESLKSNKDFRRVYDKGKSFANKYLVMFYIKNNFEFNRVGFSISKKLGKAVVRNKIKRRIKESYRLNSCKFKKGYDIIFLARINAKSTDFDKIESAVLHLGKLAGLIKKGE